MGNMEGRIRGGRVSLARWKVIGRFGVGHRVLGLFSFSAGLDTLDWVDGGAIVETTLTIPCA